MVSSPDDVGDRLWAQTPRLRLLLTHLCGPSVRSRVEIDDLVQEVLLRAVAAADQLPVDESELYGFLVVLARHAVVDAVRSIRARKRDAPGGVQRLAHGDWSQFGPRASQVLADTMGPATRVAAGEESERLRQAFETLDPDHRRVLGLRQFEGLSAKATGRRMGRSETAVHSLFRRALGAWEAALRRRSGG